MKMSRFEFAIWAISLTGLFVFMFNALSPAQAQQTIGLPYGYIELHGNEVVVGSTIDDPPKWRLETQMGVHSGAGCLTFGKRRPDGGREEMVLICAGKDERAGSHELTGELVFSIRKYVPGTPDDGQFKKVLRLRYDSIGIHPGIVITTQENF